MKTCPICTASYGDEIEVCEVDGAVLKLGSKKDPYEGKLIRGRYRVLNKIGQGGMGTVYLAEQLSVGRKVALKLLQGNYASDDEFIGRFRREARLAAALNHRNIVTLYDFDQADDGSLFIAMEYLDGEKLSDLIRREGPLEVARATRFGRQIAEGLDAAHRTGVIHRDIKPDNIMVVGASSGEEIKLMDFGIARLRDSSGTGQFTRAGLIMGTPAYMAPEQAEGAEVSEKTDIYALGIVLYEMLCGSVPFVAATPGALLVKQMQEAPVPLRKLRREVPATIERLVMQALAKNPAKRPESVAEIAQNLLRIDESLGADTATKSRSFSRWNIIGKGNRASTGSGSGMRNPPSPASPPQATVALSAESSTVLVSKPEQTWLATQPLSRNEVLSQMTRSWFSAKYLAVAGTCIAAIILVVYFVTGKSSPPPIVSISILAEKETLAPNESMVVSLQGKDGKGAVQAINTDVEWQSSDPSIAEINFRGQVQARNEGSAELTASHQGQRSQPLLITVKKTQPAPPEPVPPPKQTLVSLTLSAPKRELRLNERIALRIKGKYSDGKERELNEGVVWQSSDDRVLSVDASGRVLAHSGGDARVTANFDGMTSAALTISVKTPAGTGPEPPKPTKETSKPTKIDNSVQINELITKAEKAYDQGAYHDALSILNNDLLAKEQRALNLRAKVQSACQALGKC